MEKRVLGLYFIKKVSILSNIMDQLDPDSKIYKLVKTEISSTFRIVMDLHHMGFLEREDFRKVRTIYETLLTR